MSELVELVESVVGEARQGGALGSEVSLDSSTTRRWASPLNIRSRSTQDLVETHTDTVDASVMVYGAGGRVGHAQTKLFSSAIDSAALSALLSQAMSLSEAAQPNPLLGPADKMSIGSRGLSIADPRFDRLTDEDRRDVVNWNIGTSRSVSTRIKPRRFSLSERLTRRVFASSRGVVAEERATLYKMTAVVGSSAREGLELSGEVYSRHFSDVASRPLGAELARRLEAGTRVAKMPSESLPLVIEAHVVAEILPLITPAFDGQKLIDGESFLCGRHGEPIGPSWLHIVDDAGLASGVQTRSFDGRGVPPVALPLICDGVASGMYTDVLLARERNTRPTGHYRVDGTGWPGNLMVRPGSRTRNMLFAGLGRYLRMLNLVRPPQLDIKTGRLKLVGLFVLDGVDRSVGRVGVYSIETTIFEFFESLIDMSSDQTRFGMVDACTWVVQGLDLKEVSLASG